MIEIAVRLFKIQKETEARAHAFLSRCHMSLFQPVVMCLYCTPDFTLSAASLISLWFYCECASVKSRTSK